MARVNPRTRKPKKAQQVPQSTPGTTARIQTTTGRVSTGSSIDRLRYHQRPTIKEREDVEEDGLTVQTVGAGVIGTIGKASVKAGEVVTKIAPKITVKKAKKVGRRGIAPGVSAVTGPIEKPEPVEKVSTDIFGAAVPGHEDDSYKEGPSHLFDWGGYYNILRATAVPTEQLIQMPKDIIEGVPEEKRTMRESAIDLALMPILAPLIGQKEYGIKHDESGGGRVPGASEYQPWEYGFADPRNIFTGTMAHNLAVAGYVVQQPAYYDAVAYEYGVSAEKFEKHKPYYIATAVGEAPYFLLGVGEGAFAARMATKAAAMSVRVSTGAKKYTPGTARYFKEPIPTAGATQAEVAERATAIQMTQVSRPWLAGKGQMLAYDIESAPTRVAMALSKIRKPTPVGLTFQEIIERDAFGDIKVRYAARPAQKSRWADIGAPDSRINKFVHRITKRRQQESYDVADAFATHYKILRKPADEMLFFSEQGDVIHIPHTTGKWSGRYVGGSTRSIYENLLDPTVRETMIGQPITRYLEPTAGLVADRTRGLSQVLGDADLSKVMQSVLSEYSATTIENATLFGRTTTGAALPAKGKVTGPAYATGFMRENIPSVTEQYRPQDIIANLQRLKPRTRKTVNIKTGETYEESIPHWSPGGGPREYFPFVSQAIHGVPEEALASKITFGSADAPSAELSRYLTSTQRTGTPPAQALQNILEERGFRIYGAREPIPGTPEAKRFDKLVVRGAEIQQEIDVLTKTKAYDGMRGVSWFELTTDDRFAIISQKKYGFGGQIPNKIRGADGPDVVKLKAEYQTVRDNMSEGNAMDSERKLRSIGNKISMKMYGEKGIDSGNIREAKVVYQKARTGKLDKEFEDIVTTSLPFQTQKQITALKAQQESIAVQRKMLLDESPTAIGPTAEKLTVLLETKTDPVTGLPLKESIKTFQPPKSIRVFREPGISEKTGGALYRIEAENVDDPTSQIMSTFWAHKVTKHTAKIKQTPSPVYHEVPKKVKGTKRDWLGRKKGGTEKDVWIIEAQRAVDDPDIVGKMMGSPKNAKEQTKLLETNLGETGLLRQAKFRNTFGIEESTETIGKENLRKWKRLRTMFPWKAKSLGRWKKTDSQKDVMREEIIEGKKVYRFSNKGIDYSGDKAVPWELTRDDVEKFLAKGTTGNETKDKVLGVRHMLFGGGNELSLQQSIISDTAEIGEVSKQIDKIIIAREQKLAEAERRTTIHNIMSGQLRDERSYYRGDEIGTISKGRKLRPDEYEEFTQRTYQPSIFGDALAKYFDVPYTDTVHRVPKKPYTDVLHVNDVNEQTILRYDVEEVSKFGYEGRQVEKVTSTPKDTAKQWVALENEAKEVGVNLEANAMELKTVRGLISKDKMKPTKNAETGDTEWEIMGETGTPQGKSLSSIEVEYAKAQIDNEMTAQKYMGFRKREFERVRQNVEYQTGKKTQDGKPIIPEESGQSFKGSYDEWDGIRNEPISTPTLAGKISELAKKNPAFNEVELPNQITDVTNNLARVKAKLNSVNDDITNFDPMYHDSPHFRMLQAHQGVLEDTEELFMIKLSQLKRNKEFFAKVRAEDLIEESKNVDGELPTAITNRIMDIRKNRLNILAKGRKIHTEQYRVKKALFKRVAKKRRFDDHEYFYTPDGQKNRVLGKTAEHIKASTPLQHKLRMRRSRIELDIRELQAQKHDTLLDLNDWNITELKGYAKLNLERKLYNILIDETSDVGQITIIRKQIINLDGMTKQSDKADLLKIATDGVPDEYAKSVTVDAKFGINQGREPIKVISGGQTGMDQLGVELASNYGFGTGGTMPKGWRTTAGSGSKFAKRYGLTEGNAPDYPTRTAKNVADADLTIIYGDAKLIARDGGNVKYDKTTGKPIGPGDPIIEGKGVGSKLTLKEAVIQNKRYLVNPTSNEIASAVKEGNVKVINIAGSRKLGDSYTDLGRKELEQYFRHNQQGIWTETVTGNYNVVDPNKFVARHPDWYNTLMPEELRPIDSNKIHEIWLKSDTAHPNAVNVDGQETVRFMNVGVIKKRMKTVENELDDIKYKRTTRDTVRYRTDLEWEQSQQARSFELTSESAELKKLYKSAKSRLDTDKTVNYEYLTDESVSNYPGNLEGTIYNIQESGNMSRHIRSTALPHVEGQIENAEVNLAHVNSIVKVDPRYQKLPQDMGNWGAESHYTKWTKWNEIPQLKRDARTYGRAQLYKLHKKKADLGLKVESSQKQLAYVKDLPPKWRNFMLVPRGTIHRFTAETLARDTPHSEQTVVEIRSPINNKEYIYKNDEFYEVPEGYWTGISGQVDEFGNAIATRRELSAASDGLTPLSVSEKERLFPVPMQNIKKGIAERRKNLVNKMHTIDERYGTEPTAVEKQAVALQGLPDTYAVRQTPIGKFMHKVLRLEGGYRSRTGGEVTLAGNVNVAGIMTERFIADIGRATEKGTVGGKIVVTKTFDDFTKKYKKGSKTMYESQYPVSAYLGGHTKVIPAGVTKERIYQMPTVLPDRPTEDLVGVEKFLFKKDTGEPVRYQMDLTEEPRLVDLYPSSKTIKDVNNDMSPLPAVYETVPQKVASYVAESGASGKQVMRRTVAYKYLKNIQGNKLKQGAGADSKAPFVETHANESFKKLLSDDAYFERTIQDISDKGQARRTTSWENWQKVLLHQDVEAKHKFIDIHDVLPGDTWLGKGAPHTERMQLKHMPFIKDSVTKEEAIDPIQLAEHQALLRAARDEGVHLNKMDKKFLKMKVKLSEVDVALIRIKRSMVRETGSETGPRDYSNINFKKLAEKDPTWKPLYDEQQLMRNYLNRVEVLNTSISHNKDRLDVLEKISLSDRTKTQTNQMTSLKNKLDELKTEREVKEDYLAGYYRSPAKNKEQAIIQKILKDPDTGVHLDDTAATKAQTQLKDIQPKPIGKDKAGNVVYEETPFSGFPKQGEEGFITAREEYHKWMQSDYARGPTRKAYPYKKEYGKVEQTPAGARYKKVAEQSVRVEMKTDEQPWRVQSIYDPTYVSVADDTSPFYSNIGRSDSMRITIADVNRLKSSIAGKKLSPEGIKNTDRIISDLQAELRKIDTTDTSKFTRGELDKLTSQRSHVVEQLRSELNRRGMQSDRVKKFNPVDIEDIEKGSYTTESGSSPQAALLADSDMTSLLGTGRIQPPPPKYTGLYQRPRTAPLYATPGVATVGFAIPEAHASQGPASATLQDNLDYLSQTVSADTIQRPEVEKPDAKPMIDVQTKPGLVPKIEPRGKMGEISALGMGQETRTQPIQAEGLGLSSILRSQIKEKPIYKEAEKFKIQMPEPLRTRTVQELKERRVYRPVAPRIKLPLPVVFGWLDPEERAKKEAKLKKKKKRKIAWAAPDVWFKGKGYYFPSGAAYVGFKKKEPRVVRRQEKKLGELKWTESRTKSVFEERPITKRKPRGFTAQKESRKPRRRKKRGDLFGSTSGVRSGY